jgi:hypothetical protein
MNKFLLIAALAILVVAQMAAASCHNATGSCTKSHFVCANEEAVAHSKRCDGVEDCADGTDEYMCDQAPKPIMDLTVAERNAMTEVACVKCTCRKGAITVTSTATGYWWSIAKLAPRDFTMMTDAPTYQNKPCNPAQVSSILLNVYKKQNKGCRGWVCCFRQEACVACFAGMLTAKHCWA